MRSINTKLSLCAVAVGVAAVLAGCGKPAPVVTEAASARDAAYYAAHPDEAKARDVACNKSKVAGASFSAGEVSDCDAARKAAHEADNPVYVPSGAKHFSSAGGSH